MPRGFLGKETDKTTKRQNEKNGKKNPYQQRVGAGTGIISQQYNTKILLRLPIKVWSCLKYYVTGFKQWA